jgi:hypothetical protein
MPENNSSDIGRPHSVDEHISYHRTIDLMFFAAQNGELELLDLRNVQEVVGREVAILIAIC